MSEDKEWFTPPPENVIPLKKRSQPEWKDAWHKAESGQPLPTLFNAMLALRNHPKLMELIRFDDMTHCVMLTGQIPNTPYDATIPRSMKDGDIIAIQEEMQLTGLRRIAKATVQDAIQLIAEQNRYHPVQNYLKALVWDTKPRLDKWLTYYLGAEAEPELNDEQKIHKRRYLSEIGKLFLVAMVARVLEPGCKADYMLVLEGPQGALKSSACAVLAGQWFSDNLPDLARGDAVRLSMHLRGKWLIEIAEMSSFNAAQTHTLKEFLTQTEERYIPKYARYEVLEPRQCLFIGSTNEGTYLRDATGARRFWPVKVGVIDIDALQADRDQLLAEAVNLHNAGHQRYPDRDFEKKFIAPEQEARFESDLWEPVIANWLDGGTQVRSDGTPIIDEYGLQNSIRVETCTLTEVAQWALKIPVGMITVGVQRRISPILTRLGWVGKVTNKSKLFTRASEFGLKTESDDHII